MWIKNDMQFHIMAIKHFKEAMQVKQPACQPVHGIDDHTINLSGLNFLQQLLQGRTFKRLTGFTVVRKRP